MYFLKIYFLYFNHFCTRVFQNIIFFKCHDNQYIPCFFPIGYSVDRSCQMAIVQKQCKLIVFLFIPQSWFYYHRGLFPTNLRARVIFELYYQHLRALCQGVLPGRASADILQGLPTKHLNCVVRSHLKGHV